ncbi:MAG: MFS transporter [Spirochaetes bacterium]|nr:MFS transporter [Spirochaetota bacterium]
MNISKRLPAFESRDYRLWFFGQGISVIGTWLQNTSQAWLVLRLTNSPFKLGLVTSIQYLPSLFLSIFIGPLVDLFPKRTILIWTQSLFSLSAATLAWVCFGGKPQYWQVLLISAVTGFVNVVDYPARQSFVFEQVGDSKAVVNAVALNSTVFNVARIIGPALGGIMIVLVGIPWTFALNAISYLAVIASLVAMRAGRVSSAAASGDFWGEIKRGYRYIVGDKVIMTLLIITGTISLFIFNFNILIPSFAAITLSLGAGGYGGLMASLGLGALIAAALMSLSGTKLEPTPKLLFGSGLILCLSMILAGLQRNSLTASLSLILCGFGMASFSTMSNTAVQMQASKEMRGRVMSAYNLVFVGSTPIGALFIGKVSDSWGPATGFWLSGAICLVFLAVMIFMVAPRVFRGISSFTRRGYGSEAVSAVGPPS